MNGFPNGLKNSRDSAASRFLVGATHASPLQAARIPHRANRNCLVTGSYSPPGRATLDLLRYPIVGPLLTACTEILIMAMRLV